MNKNSSKQQQHEQQQLTATSSKDQNTMEIQVIYFLALFFLAYLLEEMGSFYIISAMEPIRKQFQISRRESLLMFSAEEIGYSLVATVLLVVYFLEKRNRGLLISIGCSAVALADILFGTLSFLPLVETLQQTSPYIESIVGTEPSRPDEIARLLGPYVNITSQRWPVGSEKEIGNMQRTDHQRNFWPILLISGVLAILGAGRTVPFSLGLPLIDDSVESLYLPFYIGGMFFIRILGPLFADLIRRATDRFYYSLDVPKGLNRKDPRWIGRWWAGFFIIGGTLFAVSVALFTIPLLITKISSQADKQPEKEPEANEESPKNGNKRKIKAEDGNPDEKKKLLEDSEAKDTDRDTEIPEKAQETSGGNGNECSIRRRKEQCGTSSPTFRKIEAPAAGTQTASEENTQPSSTGGDATVAKMKSASLRKGSSSITGNVIKNPVFIAALVGRIFYMFAFKGFFMFLPKYLEIQFRLPQNEGILIIEISAVVGFGIGIVIGSFAMYKPILKGKKAARWVLMSSAMVALISALNYTVSCTPGEILIKDMSNTTSFNNSCGAGYECDDFEFRPVCDSTGTQFYSPCLAGCSINESLLTDLNQKTFSNCECVNTTDKAVSKDFCKKVDCEWTFKLYFINMALINAFSGMGIVPTTLIVLRSVMPINRSIALGAQGFLISFLGMSCSPFVWEWFADKFSCLTWNDAYGDPVKEACAVYDNNLLRLINHCAFCAIILISFIADSVVWHFEGDSKFLNKKIKKVKVVR